MEQLAARYFPRYYRIHYFLHVGYLLALVCLVLYILDRQVEYTSRTDFLWQSKLKIEQDEVETMRGINKILLENILPAHVAEHFLTNNRATEVRLEEAGEDKGNFSSLFRFCP